MPALTLPSVLPPYPALVYPVLYCPGTTLPWCILLYTPYTEHVMLPDEPRVYTARCVRVVVLGLCPPWPRVFWTE